MRGIMVLYLVVVMFATIAEDVGFTGIQHTGVNGTDMQDDIEDISYSYTNSTGLLEPVRATTGFLNTFLSIVVNSLVFKFVIDGAPDIVNFVIRTVFFILAWLAFYDTIVLMLSILVGVVSRYL